MEGFRGDLLAEQLGHRPDVIQTNISVSNKGAVRGIHYADVPPSQAKYVTAVSGSFIDYVVDIRVGSPTFGQWQGIELDTTTRRAVYLSEGLGHCLASREDGSTAVYLCSTSYSPGREHGINPLDEQIALSFPDGIEPVLSPKDTAAPSLAQAAEQGLLPTYEQCVAFTDGLR